VGALKGGFGRPFCSRNHVIKSDGLDWGAEMKIADWFWDRVGQNPAAWFLLALFLLAEYFNYQKGMQLDAVCEAVPYADVLPSMAKTPLQKAQLICEARRDMGEENLD
jgi:hypothetical protein